MKIVYDAKTGKPRKLHNIDIREQLAAGLIVMNPLERTIPEPVQIPDQEPKPEPITEPIPEQDKAAAPKIEKPVRKPRTNQKG